MNANAAPAGSLPPPVAAAPDLSTPAPALAGADAIPSPYRRPPARDLIEQWSRLIGRLSALLREPERATFTAGLASIDAALLLLAENDADRVVFIATFLAESEARRYCAAHSLYVALVCHLASRAIDGWDAPRRAKLRGAALTMNIAMAAQQDQMARQIEALSNEQRALGAAQLRELGVDDADWLDAVARHHQVGPGALAARAPAEQIARLIHRADRLTAAHSIRLGRPARAAGDASRAAYLDESQQPDQAGAALIKALGIYPPGSLVRLASTEIGIVLRRGERADQPLVAVVVREDGMPHLSPKLRDTAKRATKITGSLAHSAIKVRLSLEALLKLTP